MPCPVFARLYSLLVMDDTEEAQLQAELTKTADWLLEGEWPGACGAAAAFGHISWNASWPLRSACE